jgi:hypothetical protein
MQSSAHQTPSAIHALGSDIWTSSFAIQSREAAVDAVHTQMLLEAIVDAQTPLEAVVGGRRSGVPAVGVRHSGAPAPDAPCSGARAATPHRRPDAHTAVPTMPLCYLPPKSHLLCL